MNHVRFFLTFLSLVTLSTAASAYAGADVTGSANLSINSKYLWRGFDLSPDSDFVVQPGVDLSLGGFTLGYWSNWDEEAGELNETDITLDYSFEAWGPISVSLGNVYYALDGMADTNELYLAVSLDTVLNPTITVNWDWDQAEKTGLFWMVGISHGFALSDTVRFNIGAMVGYNLESDYSVGDYSDFHHGELSAGFDWEAVRGLVLSPTLIYSFPLSDKAEDAAGIDDELMLGVTLGYSF